MDTHPGFATDLLFDRYQGNVVDHEQFWAVRTPDAPDYYFGNYLLPPFPSDHDKGWLEASFDKLIGQDPGSDTAPSSGLSRPARTAGLPASWRRDTSTWSAWYWHWRPQTGNRQSRRWLRAPYPGRLGRVAGL